MVYITSGLAETLLRLAGERAPESITVSVSVTPAADLVGANVPSAGQVFTHFYLPEAGGSVNAVFGVDLGTPPRQTQGRFVSHPMGDLEVSVTDDLHEVVFVGVPPWDEDSLAAFDRSGTRQELAVIDAEPPEESVSF